MKENIKFKFIDNYTDSLSLLSAEFFRENKKFPDLHIRSTSSRAFCVSSALKLTLKSVGYQINSFRGVY